MLNLNFFIFTALIIFNYAHAQNSIEDCLAKDSISCIQMQIYRKAREFFTQDNIDIFNTGISLTRNPTDRNAKSSENVLLDQQVEAATNVIDREGAIESFVWGKVRNFFQERSINWNVGQTARSLINAVPEEVKNDVSDLVSEGRGKKKKALKKILPLLVLFKLKLVLLLVLGYIITVVIAKKAIVASLISLLISGYIALKKLISKSSHEHHHEEVAYHSAPSSGWQSSGWDDHAGSYSSPIAQHLAYGGQIKHRK